MEGVVGADGEDENGEQRSMNEEQMELWLGISALHSRDLNTNDDLQESRRATRLQVDRALWGGM